MDALVIAALQVVQRRWVAISLLLLLLISTLSLSPMDTLPSVPGGDKSHHFLAYAALMFPVVLSQYRYWIWVGLFFLGWSGAIELLQPSVSRFAEWRDLLANGAGLACGALVGRSVLRLFPAVRSVKND